MVWLMLLLAMLLAMMWGKLAQWGELGTLSTFVDRRARFHARRKSSLARSLVGEVALRTGPPCPGCSCARHSEKTLSPQSGQCWRAMAELGTQRCAPPAGNGKNGITANGF